MDALFLGIFDVVPCRYSRIFCRESTGTLYRASAGKAIHAIDDEDLTSDTAKFGDNSRLRIQRIKMIDSLIYLLSLTDYKGHLNSIYFFGRSISPPVNIFPNDRTIQQLKSSGGLRLIRKTEVSNGIMAYDQEMRLHLFQLTDELEMRAEYRQLVRNIFDGKVVFSMLQKTKFERPQNNPPLFKDDPASINALINEAQYFKKADETQVARIAELVKLAEALMELIKKEYDLN